LCTADGLAMSSLSRTGYAISNAGTLEHYLGVESAVIEVAAQLASRGHLCRFDSLAFGDADVPPLAEQRSFGATPSFAIGMLETVRRALTAKTRGKIALFRSR
jgi:hypothetical protein